MRLLAPLLCLTWAAVAHADAIDDAITAAAGKVLIVHFDHPLCPYSPATKASLTAAAAETALLSVHTVDVTTTPGKALAVKYNVGGTPSLKMWLNAQNGPIDLPGGRTGLEIADTVVLYEGAAVKEFAALPAGALDAWRKHHAVAILEGGACSPAQKTEFRNFALANRDKAIFVQLNAGGCQVTSHSPTQDGFGAWVLQSTPRTLTGDPVANLRLFHELYPRSSRRFEPMSPRVYNRHLANDVGVCWLFEDLHLTDATAIANRAAVRTAVRELFDHKAAIADFNPFSKGQFAFVVTDLQTDLTKAKALGYTSQPGINIGCEFNGNSFFHNEAGPTLAAAFATNIAAQATTWKMLDPQFGPYA